MEQRNRRRGYFKPEYALMYVTAESYKTIPTTQVVQLDKPNRYGETQEEVPILTSMPELLTMRSFLDKKPGYLLYNKVKDGFVFAPFNIQEILEMKESLSN